jgi:poly(hydroxyalkanoate) depolymerase family esterase
MQPRRVRRQVRTLARALMPRRRRTPRAAPPIDRTESGQRASARTWVPRTYGGAAGARSYYVYVPPGIRRRTRVPLVVVLHGCSQTAAEFAAATRFNDVADRHGFIIVYPEQARWNHQQRCWHWYEAAHQARGVGEPAIIAGITSVVVAEATRWRIDPSRVYVAGLSAGGAMALVLAATYPDVYAAVGVHSAPAYRSASNTSDALGAMAGRTVLPPPHVDGVGTRGMPPAILFYGTADNTVYPRNGQRVAEQWLAYYQAYVTNPRDPERIVRHKTLPGRSSDGRTYTTTRWYTASGHKVLEYWQVDGLGHAWSGGADGGSYSDPRGPRASTAMWSFFSAKRLQPPARTARAGARSALGRLSR